MKFNRLFRISFFIILFNCINSYAQIPVIEWQRTLGGTGSDQAYCIRATPDGGYIVAGFTTSANGDVTSNHGGYDFWVVKLNADGTLAWQKSYGGFEFEKPNSIDCTSDGGYILAGYTDSHDGDITINYGVIDFWILKIDALGNIQWQKSDGGTYYDQAMSVKQASDGGYIVAGYTESNTGNFSGNHGAIDILLVKLSATGNVQWRKMYGGTLYERAYSIQCTTHGGYIMTGYAESRNGDVSTTNGNDDYWVVKLDSLGNIQWEKTYGGIDLDIAHSIQCTPDGGYIVGGVTNSNNTGGVAENLGGYDYWILKLDVSGNIEWKKVMGGAGDDYFRNLKATADNGCIVVGYSINSEIEGNYGLNQRDCWIIRFSATGTVLWQKVIGGSDDDRMESVDLASDGGYIMAGYTQSNDGDVTGFQGFSDYLVVKLTNENLANDAFSKTAMTIFPNPARHNFTLKLDSYTPSQSILITDVSGKIIHSQHTKGLTTIIDVSHFEKGIYFLTLFDGKHKTAQKFIVE